MLQRLPSRSDGGKASGQFEDDFADGLGAVVWRSCLHQGGGAGEAALAPFSPAGLRWLPWGRWVGPRTSAPSPGPPRGVTAGRAHPVQSSGSQLPPARAGAAPSAGGGGGRSRSPVPEPVLVEGVSGPTGS